MKVELPDIEVTCLGTFECQQCYTGFLTLFRAIEHQQQIDKNDGVCPDKEEVENEDNN